MRSCPVICSPLFYAASKFAAAAHHMAVSELPLRDRLREARRHFYVVGAADLPAAAVADFRSFLARTSWAPSRGQGAFDATLALISDAEVRRLAHLLCDISTSLQAALADAFAVEAVDHELRERALARRRRARRALARKRSTKAVH